MSLYCVKCSIFIKNRKKIIRKIDGKINLYSCCIDYGFKKFEAIDEEKLSYLVKDLT